MVYDGGIMAIEQLLAEISSINKRYEEIARISGENFNVFNILGLTSKEMIHSKFIAMLLDPKAEHTMGDLFIKLFIDILKKNHSGMDNYTIDYSDVSDIKVETEKSIINGRIDILITKGNNNIIIENKIYAGDQDDQLKRYHEYCPDAVLLYLTLDGDTPSEKSAKELKDGTDYYCISYREDILNWLELCIKETAKSPFLRETLNQYILLIKQLTGQTRSRKMKNEVLDIIRKDGESFTAFLTLNGIEKKEVFDHVLKIILFELERIANDCGLDFEKNEENILAYEYGFNFTKPAWGNFAIRFLFDNNLSDLQYGIYSYEKDPNGKDKGWWQGELKSMGEYKNWHWTNNEGFTKLCCQTEEVIKEIENKVKDLIPKVEEIIKQ